MAREIDPPTGHDASFSPEGTPSGKTRWARSENMLSTVWLSFSAGQRLDDLRTAGAFISILTMGPRFNEIVILGMSGLLLRFVFRGRAADGSALRDPAPWVCSPLRPTSISRRAAARVPSEVVSTSRTLRSLC